MAKRPTVEAIFTTATRLEAAKWGRFDLAKFHMFNPNGIAAEWKALGDAIMEAAEAGRCKNGAWIAYGPIGHYQDELMRLSRAKQFKVSDLTVILGLIRQTIERGQEFLDSLPAAE